MGKREKDGSKSSCAYTQTIVRLYANDCATIRDLKHFKTTEFCCLLTLSSCFNPRPYERGDRRPHIAPRSEVCFNPRPYERGDNHSGENIPNVLQFQSTPLREGRPFLLRLRCVGAGVSIHAPTRGATLQPEPRSTAGNVSIHAPTRGATAQTPRTPCRA